MSYTQPSASCMQFSTSPSSTMSPSTPLSSPNLSRKLLPYHPLENSPLKFGSTTTSPANPRPITTMGSFDANVIATVAALVCAVTIGLVLNCIIQLTFQVLKQRWCQIETEFEPERNHVNQGNQFGVKRKALRTLPILVYSDRLSLDSECMICLSEFAAGEKVRVLTKCNHGFHQRCIDQWFEDHSSCPTCRQCSFGKNQLVVADTEVGRTTVQRTEVNGLALSVERLIENCREIC